jgi:hypothetical protein
MMGVSGATSRIHAVADTPSNMGMMMSMKMRSYLIGSWLTLFTASDPSRCYLVSYARHAWAMAIRDRNETHRNLDGTIDICQELGTDPRARLVVFDQQYPRLLGTP